MYSSVIVTIFVGLAATTSAAPASDVERDIAARDEGVQCGYKSHLTWPHVGIYVPGNLMPSAQGNGEWGGGLIDNLHGAAPADVCNPISWQATPDEAGTGLIATFNVQVSCRGDDISKALQAASGVWTICNDDIGAYGDEALKLGIDGAKMLADFIPKPA